MDHVQSRFPHRENGIVLPFVALMMGIFIVMTAFAIDIGAIVLARTELQATADSASLAACQELLARELLEGAPSAKQSLIKARNVAVDYAAKHKAGGVTLALDRNDGNSTGGDIVLGFMANPRVPAPLDLNIRPYNSVQVTVHRDDIRNQPLGLFFGQVAGLATAELEATATATLDTNLIGFKITENGPSTAKLLPFALHVNDWNRLFTSGPDSWSWDRDTQLVTSGPDNIREIKALFPTALAPGNFGTFDIGSPGNATGELVRQILYGPNAVDFAYYPNGEFKLGVNGTLMVGGDTGKSTGIKDAVTAIHGQPRVIALYSNVVGTGNEVTYTIVAFAGIVITDSRLTGSTPYITIQPSYVRDASGIGGGTPQTSRFVYRAIVLSR